MAQSAAGLVEDDLDTPMIEEQVDTGLLALLESYRSAYVPGGATPNLFDDRFAFDPEKPIPELCHRYADAFEATDSSLPNRKLYAMVMDPDFPYRLGSLNDLTGLVSPHFQLPVAMGTVNCSHLGEARHVMFFPRPTGLSLIDMVQSNTRLHENKVIDHVLTPACNALIAMREKKLSHGNIYPGAFYASDTSVLGECFTAPTNTLAHYLYYPIERLMASELGRGGASEKGDVYALGVLAYELIFGLERLKTIPQEEFIDRVLKQGLYQAFTGGRDLTEATQDLFRGILNDTIADRWGLDQLQQYLTGKRFNMIAPSAPKDASRPFIFMQDSIFSRRQLANVLHKNWREALKDIRSLRIERWCEMSLHRPELGERIERALRIGMDPSAGERQLSDMMTRIFCVLDPAGPLRSKSLSLHPDAIPLQLSVLMPDRGSDLTQLITMIDTDVTSFWVEQLDTNKSPEKSQLIWKLQRVKAYIKNRALGFGMERALYELNPNLPCQSPLLKPYHVMTAIEALNTLDMLAKNLAPDTSLVDRHVAAFIAAKIEMTKELRLGDLSKLPALEEHPELYMLKLLVKAQSKYPKLKLVGLCAWAGTRVEKMLDEIHNRVIRKQQKLRLKRLASSGLVRDVMTAVLNHDIISRDNDGFVHAVALHQINTKRIEYLSSAMILEYKARKTGGKVAVLISYTTLTIMAYATLMNLLGI